MPSCSATNRLVPEARVGTSFNVFTTVSYSLSEFDVAIQQRQASFLQLAALMGSKAVGWFQLASWADPREAHGLSVPPRP
jgi:hypothetical protein